MDTCKRSHATVTMGAAHPTCIPCSKAAKKRSPPPREDCAFLLDPGEVHDGPPRRTHSTGDLIQRKSYVSALLFFITLLKKLIKAVSANNPTKAVKNTIQYRNFPIPTLYLPSASELRRLSRYRRPPDQHCVHPCIQKLVRQSSCY